MSGSSLPCPHSKSCCPNPKFSNATTCTNKKLSAPGLMFKNVPKRSLPPRGGFWRIQRKVICCIQPWHAPEVPYRRRVVFNPNIGQDNPLDNMLG